MTIVSQTGHTLVVSIMQKERSAPRNNEGSADNLDIIVVTILQFTF